MPVRFKRELEWKKARRAIDIEQLALSRSRSEAGQVFPLLLSYR